MSAELAVIPPLSKTDALERMNHAGNVASVCKEIVKRTAMDLKGRKYVRCEGWTSIAAAYGCVVSVREVLDTADGIEAIAELRNDDGTVLATASGFVGNDEPLWAARPLFARRGMASTRAVSRVCRTAFSFIVVMMDAGLEVTPAEEMGGEDVAPEKAARVVNAVPATTKPASPAGKPIPFGKNRGKQLSEVNDADLKWLLAAAIQSVNANAKPEFLESNKAWLAQCEAEAARRIQG